MNAPKKYNFLGISGAESEQGYIVLTDVTTIEVLKNVKIKSIRIMILPVVSCGHESWSLTLRREPRLRMFENKVLRKLFRPKRVEGTGEWRRLRSEELSDLYSLPYIIRVIKSRRMRWAENVLCVVGRGGSYRVLVGKPEGKSHLEELGLDGNILVGWIVQK